MKFNTALSFVLSGIALFFMSRAKEGKESVAKVVLPVLAFFIFFLMANLLLTYFVNISSGLESLFVKGETPFPTVSLGVPSIPTILNFIMLGTSFILFSFGRSKKIIEGTGIAVLISGVIAVIGHIINSPPLFFLAKDVSSGMALHTSTSFVIVSSVIIFLQHQKVQELKKDDSTKVKTKILFVLLACSIVPLVFISITTYETNRVTLLHKTLDELQAITDLQEERINDYVDRHLTFMTTNTARPLLIDNFEKYQRLGDDEFLSAVNTVINAIKASNSKIKSVSLLNPSGIVTASTDNTFLGSDLSSVEYFTSTIKGSTNLDVSLNEDKIYFTTLSGPLLKENNIVGVMVLYVDDSEFFYTINKGLGKTGEDVLVRQDEKGNIEFITPLKFDSTAKSVLADEHNLAVEKVLRGDEELYPDAIDYRGIPVLVATRYIDGTGWGLVVKVDKTEFVGPLDTITNLGIYLTATTTIMVTCIALILSHSITTPLKTLTELAEHVRNGFLTKRSKLRLADEIGVLSNAFDIMLNKIEDDHKIITKQVEDLKELDKRKEEFVSMVTHELKTPLSPIFGWCQALLDFNIMGTLNPAQVNAVNTVYERAIKLRNLITDLLDAQKLDLKTIKFDYMLFRVNDLLDDLMNTFKPLIKAKQIQLINSTKENLELKSDKNRIEQILTNLIYNAIEFVPEKTGIIEININSDNDTLVFMVKDNGIGISEELQANLFQKFYQVDTSLRRKHGGVGLGLAVCKGLVEGLGGKIWVDSKQGVGAGFYFTIPKERNSP